MKRRLFVPAAFAALLLAGCSAQPSTSSGTPVPLPSPIASGDLLAGPVQPAGTPTDILTGLQAPWSILRLASAATLISERDSGTVTELLADGNSREVGTVSDVVHDGEGGLLGLEALVDGDQTWLYAYFTSASDNRIVRYQLKGAPGSYVLGQSEEILTGLAKAGNHDGGRIKFGPDGELYATVGDASNRDASQDVDSLNGKILRMDPDGSVPADNPFEGSLVWSMGHRNPQGIAWAEDGTMYAAEFGQDTWDELNIIKPGSNYGWPVVEGQSDNADFVNPVYQWATDDASPSGLAVVRDTIFMASLKGERLWVIYPPADRDGQYDAVDYFAGELGRIRDVTAGSDGSLWLITNNTDGRGSPRDGDDRLIEVQLTPLVEG